MFTIYIFDLIKNFTEIEYPNKEKECHSIYFIESNKNPSTINLGGIEMPLHPYQT